MICKSEFAINVVMAVEFPTVLFRMTVPDPPNVNATAPLRLLLSVNVSPELIALIVRTAAVPPNVIVPGIVTALVPASVPPLLIAIEMLLFKVMLLLISSVPVPDIVTLPVPLPKPFAFAIFNVPELTVAAPV